MRGGSQAFCALHLVFSQESGPGRRWDGGREPGAPPCCQWDGKVPPKGRHAEMIGMARAAQASPEHRAAGLRTPGFQRSLPNFRLLSNYG